MDWLLCLRCFFLWVKSRDQKCRAVKQIDTLYWRVVTDRILSRPTIRRQLVREVYVKQILVCFLACFLFESARAQVQQPRMADRMVFRQAPVPNAESRKDLTLFAAYPGDLIVITQKRSLLVASPEEHLLPSEQVINLYKEELTQKMSPSQADTLLKSGFKVYKHFINGIKNKQTFEQVTASDRAQMWQLVVPNTIQVTSSILQLEWFSAGLGGHAQVRLKLSQPLLLISEDAPHTTQFIDGDIVYSLMALRTLNGADVWGPVTGLTGAFANTYMVASAAHMASIQTNVSNGSYIEQYEMNFSAQQNQNLLNYVLTNGSRAKENEIYNLIYNSCIQAALRALRTVDSRIDASEFNPYVVVPKLRQLGLIKKQLQSNNREFNSPVQSLRNSQNSENLALVAKLRPLMNSTVFSESIRLIAAVIIEDRWTASELNQLIEAVSRINLKGLSTEQMPNEIARVISQAQLPSKTQASAMKLASEIIKTLQRNNLEMKDLLYYLQSSSIAQR